MVLCVVLSLPAAADDTTSAQYGAQRIDFQVGSTKGFVILPAKASPDGSKPWVWYAPTFIGSLPDDSHAWMAKQLLESGFAIAGVDVGESYGSPAGTKQYSEFYEYVCSRFALSVKACLLPQSRGGLMLLNWAAENPAKVQCVAGIYTVCNLESYPGVEKACGAYGVDAATLRISLQAHNPIDRTKPLADAKVPILFIHGDSDTVVPIGANSGEYAKRCRAQGGKACVLVVPGKGHEVCPEFFHDDRFVKFLLAQGNPATTN